MAQPFSCKNEHEFVNLVDNLSDHLQRYQAHFFTETGDSSGLGHAYILGLLKTEAGKRNLERMLEEHHISGDGYQRIQQFITDSPWSSEALISSIAADTCALYAEQPGYRIDDVGYIIDESGHIKSGKHSVGVARQYAGVVGKVENCQIGVYVSLVWKTHSTLINERLFLPEAWTSDTERCEKAGIPEHARQFKTKLELALEMVQADIDAGVRFGWVGGDGLYGHGYEFGNALENMGLKFFLDIHCDQKIYRAEPHIEVPPKRSNKGRPPTKPKADLESLEVQHYMHQLRPDQWEQVTVRDGTKGPLTLSVFAAKVWVWDGISETARPRTLVITRNLADNKIKYSLTNFALHHATIERLAYMQAQRYWVERAFQEAKSELGMSDYQVRKWNAWHHHMALVMLTLSFLVKERIVRQETHPLVSCRDVRLLIIALLTQDPELIQKRVAQMEFRHAQRRRDIERRRKPAADRHRSPELK